MAGTAVRGRLTWQVATVTSVIREADAVRTIGLDVPDWPGHRAGQHLDVRLTAEDGYSADQLELRGPIGRWFVWDTSDVGPLLLVAGGSGSFRSGRSCGAVSAVAATCRPACFTHPAPWRTSSTAASLTSTVTVHR
jgi:hypothetical protein